MEIIRTHFLKNIFLYIIGLLIIVISIISYNRFIIKNDYVVGYEGACDPAINKCFIGCEDDACTKEYYYSEMTKYAPNIYRECGKDITECEVANECLPGDRKCSITYCESDIAGNNCTTLPEKESLKDININKSL